MTATMERTPTVMAADTLTGDKVVNFQKEDLGKIEHLMIDLESDRIATRFFRSAGSWAWVTSYLPFRGVPLRLTRLNIGSF